MAKKNKSLREMIKECLGEDLKEPCRHAEYGTSMEEMSRKGKAIRFSQTGSGIDFMIPYCKLTDKKCFVVRGEQRFYLELLDLVLSLKTMYPEFCPASKVSEDVYRKTLEASSKEK